MRMAKAMVATALMAAAGVAHAGDSAKMVLDLRTGPRASGGDETLAFSSLWDGGADATVTIAQDGVAIAENLAGEGERAWSVPYNGTYELTHVTCTNGVAGKVETAKFVVTGKADPPPVSYLDPTDTANPDKVCTAYTPYTGHTTLKTGWYVVSGTKSCSNRIKVSGDVNLILADGASLTANAGVNVDVSVAVVDGGEVVVTNSLTIWVQSDAAAEGSSAGKLIATGGNFAAGIGGGDGGSGGTVTINGGKVTAQGGSSAAGIGGGSGNSGGAVTVNGGEVTATGGDGGAGIGGGNAGTGGAVTVNGGMVTAQGGGYAAGIGGGYYREGGMVTVTGGAVTAQGGAGAVGIGGGSYGSSGTVTVKPSAGTAVAVAAGADAGSAVPIDGSPFMAEEDVSGRVEGKKFVRTWAPQFHAVTVVGGSTTNSPALEGSVVTVVADEPESGHAFVQWARCDGVDFADASAAETTFTMPTNDVTVTAVFAEIRIGGLDGGGYPWTGKPVEPEVAVSLKGVDMALRRGTDYAVSYADNVDPGTATLTVTMLLPGLGSRTATFTILPRPSVSNVAAAVRGPWNGKVELTFATDGNWSGLSGWNAPVLSIVATDHLTGSNYVSAATALSARAPYQLADALAGSNGTHEVTWDFTAQGIDFSSTNVTFTVAYLKMPDYCVIDLSGGSNATSYAVSYLDAEPEGGFTNDLYRTTKLAMRLIGPGTFKMGGTTETEITNAFYCAVFETTQKQWELVKGDRPSWFTNETYYATRPVEKISWNMIRGDADTYDWPNVQGVASDSFVGVLRQKTGLDALDLPAGAQWEYACRAGTTTDFNNGKNLTAFDQCSNMDDIGRYRYNGGYVDGTSLPDQDCATNYGTVAVGSYMPNGSGLYDMHGNVLEWCLDSAFVSHRMLRGGSWDFVARFCISSNQSSSDPSDAYNYFGFRLVRTLSNNLESERSAVAAAGAERAGTVCAGVSPQVEIMPTYTVTVVDGSTTNSLAAVGSTVAITANEPSAGEAFVQWTSNDGVNFDKADAAETTFVMPAKSVTVTAVYAPILIKGLSGQGYPYTGEPIEPEVTVEFEGVDIELERGRDYEVSYTGNTNAGTANLTVTMLPPRLGSQSATFGITKRQVSFAGQSETNAYTGSEIEITGVVAEGLVSGHTHNVVFSAKGTDVGGPYEGVITDAGDVVILSGEEDVTANYDVTAVTGGALTIEQDPGLSFTVSLEDASYVYDGSPHALAGVATNDALSGVTTVEYSKDGSTWTNDLSSLVASDVSDSCTIYVRATNPNYANAATFTATLTITPARVGGGTEEPGGGEVPVGGESKFDAAATYDGEGHAIDTNALETAFGAAVIGDFAVAYAVDDGGAPAATWTAEPPSFTNAGEYAVWYKVANPNYEDFVHAAKVKITQRVVTFAGQSETNLYSGAEIEITGVVVSNLVVGHTHNVTFSAKGTEVGGPYDGTITDAGAVSISDGDVDVTANYDVSVVNGALTIEQDPSLAFTVSLEGESFVYDGSPHALTGVAAGTALTGATTFEYSKDGSNWTADLSSLVAEGVADTCMILVRATNPNYANAATTSATLTITPANVGGGTEEPGNGEVPAGGESKFDAAATYDGDGHSVDTNALEAAFSAVMVGGGDSAFTYALDDGGAPAATWTAEPPSFTNAGEYAVWYKVANPNYEDFVHAAKVKITARPVTLTSGSASKVYDGTPVTCTDVLVGADGFAPGE